MTDDDRRLAQRLRGYEAHLQVDDEPPATRSRSAMPFAPMAAFVAVLVVAMVGIGLFLADRRPVGQAEPTATATASITIAPSPSQSAATVDWGPLAVIDSGGFDARTEGTLVITDECVFLDTFGERWLLIWHADRTRWDSDRETITFVSIRGEEVTVGNGDYVVLGGGGWSTEEDGVEPQEWAETIDWVQGPADECLTDVRWAVSNVSSIGVPTPTPEPSPAAWVPLPMEEGDTQFRGVGGVVEWNGTLLAVGGAGSPDGAIWISGDGSTWERATIPAAPPGMGVSLQAPFAVGDRLFVFGTTFNPAGSGPIGSVLWTSADGMTWIDTPASAQFDAAPLGVIGVRGQMIVAAENHELPSGSAFWISQDAGVTWERSTFDLEGAWATHGLVHDGAFIAVGSEYEASSSDSTATTWTSTDGLAWTQVDLGPGYASRIAELPDRTLLVIGGIAGQSEVTALGWASDDGREWMLSEIDLACCGTEFAVTPSGLIVVHGATDGSGSAVSTSSDGLNWSVAGPLAGEMRGVAWSETFGVIIWGVDPEGRPAVIVDWEPD
jgi:hypothetical protein